MDDDTDHASDGISNQQIGLVNGVVSKDLEDCEDNLSSDQTEQLLHFQDLTGIDDIGRCRQLLLNHNWEMESAVRAHFADQEVRSQPQLPPVDTRMPIINLHPLDQRVYTIIHRRPAGIIGWGYWIVSFPFQYFYSKFLSLFRFTCRLLWHNPRKAITNPLDDVKQFRQHFTKTYGHRHPNFIEGTYSQAVNMARRDLRFLLVFLHNSRCKQNDAFCRNVLSSEAVVEFLNSMFLVWGCDIDSPEGHRVLQSMSEKSDLDLWIAILVQRRNRLTVVAKMEDFCDASDFLKRLRHIVNDNQHFILAATVEREEINLTHTIRQEQDEAYLLSLKADQEKELARRKEKELKEELDRLAKEEEQQQCDELSRKKSEARERLLSEPEATDPSAIKIMLQLPNGMRLDRCFRKTDSITALYDYLLVHEASPDNFRIIHDFPRRTLPCKPSEYLSESSTPTFEDVGLGRSELLFVHDEDA